MSNSHGTRLGIVIGTYQYVRSEYQSYIISALEEKWTIDAIGSICCSYGNTINKERGQSIHNLETIILSPSLILIWCSLHHI